MAPTATLRKHIVTLEQSTAARAATDADGKKLRRFKEFYDGAASWDRVERIIARVRRGRRARIRASSSPASAGLSGRTVYQDIYCARGQAENHIKAWKTHLAADRTSCCRASANQMRLFLHVGAYWLMWSLRTLMPRRSRWRVAQFDTLRLRLIKLAVRIEVLKTQGPPASAEGDPGSGDLRVAADPHAAPQPLSDGADCPTCSTADQPQRLPATKACPNGP